MQTAHNVNVLLFALALPLAAQQPADDWSLRAPVQTTGSAVAPHPVTGRPVRFGGTNPGFGAVEGTWEWDGTSWQRRLSTTSPEPRSGHAMATDEGRGEIVMFGGSNWPSSNDTWTWNGLHWQAHPTPLLLTQRTGHAMAYDSVRGRLVLFGGSGLNDTWEWDGQSWSLRQPGAPPSARIGHKMAFDAARGRVVMFGGKSGNIILDDTWEWDGTYWTQRFSTNRPLPRFDHAMAYDRTRQRVVLFAGTNFHPLISAFGDTWEWDGTVWTQVSTPVTPPPRADYAMLWDSAQSRIVMLADDVWEYDGITWLQTGAATLPQPRSNAAMAFDPPRGSTVLFGGFRSQSGSNNLGDTWTWDGQRWQEQAPTQSPSARHSHAIAFDTGRGVPVLFGGSAYTSGVGTTIHDDTWSWDGSTWTHAQPATRPPPRSSHGLAYHAASQRLVLFGGAGSFTTSAITVLADTWTWDGIDWRQEFPIASPPARYTPGLTEEGQHVLLFGGGYPTTGNNTQSLADTWRWDGTNWTQLQPAVSPPSRYFHMIAYDSDRDRVLLTGGGANSSTTTVFQETWAWDGNDWTQLTTTTMPTARSGGAMTYDPDRRQTLLFGGVRSGYQNDTWALAAAGNQTTFGTGCAGTMGIPTVQASPSSLPELGGIVIVDLTNLPTAIAAMTMGFSNTTAGGQSLPLALGAFGMPGCDLLVAPDATTLLLASVNAATWNLPLPFAPSFLGLEFFYQGLAYDPPTNSAGVVVSNGGRCQIGH